MADYDDIFGDAFGGALGPKKTKPKDEAPVEAPSVEEAPATIEEATPPRVEEPVTSAPDEGAEPREPDEVIPLEAPEAGAEGPPAEDLDIPIAEPVFEEAEAPTRPEPELPFEDTRTQEEICLDAVRESPTAIMDMVNPSEAVQVEAVSKLGYAWLIERIDNPTEAAKLAAVRSDSGIISQIDDPSEDVQLVAVRDDPELIDHIQNPDESVQKEAVSLKPDTIRYITDPSEDVQLVAVRHDPNVLELIAEPTEAVKSLAVADKPGLDRELGEPVEGTGEGLEAVTERLERRLQLTRLTTRLNNEDPREQLEAAREVKERLLDGEEQFDYEDVVEGTRGRMLVEILTNGIYDDDDLFAYARQSEEHRVAALEACSTTESSGGIPELTAGIEDHSRQIRFVINMVNPRANAEDMVQRLEQVLGIERTLINSELIGMLDNEGIEDSVKLRALSVLDRIVYNDPVSLELLNDLSRRENSTDTISEDVKQRARKVVKKAKHYVIIEGPATADDLVKLNREGRLTVLFRIPQPINDVEYNENRYLRCHVDENEDSTNLQRYARGDYRPLLDNLRNRGFTDDEAVGICELVEESEIGRGFINRIREENGLEPLQEGYTLIPREVSQKARADARLRTELVDNIKAAPHSFRNEPYIDAIARNGVREGDLEKLAERLVEKSPETARNMFDAYCHFYAAGLTDETIISAHRSDLISERRSGRLQYLGGEITDEDYKNYASVYDAYQYRGVEPSEINERIITLMEASILNFSQARTRAWITTLLMKSGFNEPESEAILNEMVNRREDLTMHIALLRGVAYNDIDGSARARIRADYLPDEEVLLDEWMDAGDSGRFDSEEFGEKGDTVPESMDVPDEAPDIHDEPTVEIPVEVAEPDEESQPRTRRRAVQRIRERNGERRGITSMVPALAAAAVVALVGAVGVLLLPNLTTTQPKTQEPRVERKAEAPEQAPPVVKEEGLRRLHPLPPEVREDEPEKRERAEPPPEPKVPVKDISVEVQEKGAGYEVTVGGKRIISSKNPFDGELMIKLKAKGFFKQKGYGYLDGSQEFSEIGKAVRAQIKELEARKMEVKKPEVKRPAKKPAPKKRPKPKRKPPKPKGPSIDDLIDDDFGFRFDGDSRSKTRRLANAMGQRNQKVLPKGKRVFRRKSC